MIEGSLIFGELDEKKQNNYTNQTNAYILVLFLTSLIYKQKSVGIKSTNHCLNHYTITTSYVKVTLFLAQNSIE